MISTDVLVVGGGLSGLSLADKLQAAGINFHLLEARDRFGGRIKAFVQGDAAHDLGPSWFWPGQSRMASLANRFGLGVFEQYATGALSYEDEHGEVIRNQGWASMQGSLRIEGGMFAVVDAIAATLKRVDYSLNTRVARIVKTATGVEALDRDGKLMARAKRVVLAVPPRVATTMTFNPPLPDIVMKAASAIPTWMAGHAKFVAVYDTPFWRDEGLSGDAMSRCGPMVEIHDASDPRSKTGALFGFLGIPAHVRAQHKQEVLEACVAQLGNIFGRTALSPLASSLQDWALEPETAIEADQTPPADHPQYGMPAALNEIWGGALLFGSSEVGHQFGGFLEGALEASEMTFAMISAARSPIAG